MLAACRFVDLLMLLWIGFGSASAAGDFLDRVRYPYVDLSSLVNGYGEWLDRSVISP